MSDLSNFIDKKGSKKPSRPTKHPKTKPKIINRKKAPSSLEQLDKEQLIQLLEPLMAEIPGFAANMAWTRQKILPLNPNVHPEELAQKLAIPLLEAYMILSRLQSNQDSFSSC
ncbi:MAG: hypothetical protein JSV04_12300 [Candidatus Heimdallarchaeota archaeon]|nr:MAG: hypothetical protein JSV04_12300 [Candidatus Heimdallarchaeota archaeon]